MKRFNPTRLPVIKSANETIIDQNFRLMSRAMQELWSSQEAILASPSSPPASTDAAVILAPETSLRNVVQPTLSTVVPLVLMGAASQSANLLTWQNSSSVSLGGIDANGQITMSRSAAATTNEMKVENTNSAAGSNALIRIKTESSTSSGDPLLIFDKNGATGFSWVLGLDSDDFGRFKITAGPDFATGIPALYIDAGEALFGSTSGAGKSLRVARKATGDSLITAANYATGLTTTSRAGVVIQVGDGSTSSGSDAFLSWINAGSRTWTCGLDNSDSDAWVLSESATLGSSNIIRIGTGGVMSLAGTLSVSSTTTLTVLSGTGDRIVMASATGVLSATTLYGIKAAHAINSNVSSAGNVGTGEDDLLSYTVPASTLATNGDSLRVEAGGVLAAATSRLRAYFGSSLIFDSGSMVVTPASDWCAEIVIMRTGATTQKAMVKFQSQFSSLTSYCEYSEPSATLSSSNVLKFTGEATSDNDVVQNYMLTQLVPAQ